MSNHNHHLAQRFTGVRSAVLVVLLLSQSGCLKLTNAGDPVQLYRLTAIDKPVAAIATPVAMAINVESSKLLDSQRLWVVQDRQQLQAYAGLRWVMPLPELFRQTLVASLESSTMLVAVPAPMATAELQLELRSMQIEVPAQGQAVAVAGVLASYNGKHGRPVVHQLFSASVPADAGSATSVATAADKASQKLITDVQAWLQRLLVEVGNAEPGNAEPGNAEPGNAEPGNAEPQLGHKQNAKLGLGAPSSVQASND